MSGSSRYIFSLIFVFSFLVNSPLFAQKSKEQLQQEKRENLKKIEQAKKILDQTSDKKKNTLGQLSALNQQIKAQEDLINSIRGELSLLTEDIEETNLIIESLENDLNNLKKEYGAMVYATYKANKGFNKLTFIFSASSFNQFFMRLKYMEQYGIARKKQAEQINKVQNTLTDQITIIESKRSEKNILLAEQLKESRSLTNLRENKSLLVDNLQQQESQLKKDLEDRKKAVARLDNLINDIIKEEIARAKTAEKTTADASLKLSNEFIENKSRFPWPVSGFVSQKFGRQNHPVLRGIVINSTGVNIQTKANERVKSIFNGTVSTVAFVPLVGNTVVVSHGGYFTVYAGLKKVYVKKGQQINTNQEIGEILTNKDGVSELKFEIRKNVTALDPQQWLIRK